MKEPEAQKLIDEAGSTWADFLEFMNGQTIGIYPDGDTDFYDTDVHRFIRYFKQGRKENSFEWD